MFAAHLKAFPPTSLLELSRYEPSKTPDSNRWNALLIQIELLMIFGLDHETGQLNFA